MKITFVENGGINCHSEYDNKVYNLLSHDVVT